MKAKYETLDEYLDDLDAIKEKVAEKTHGMSTKEVIAYFARSKERLLKRTGKRLNRRAKRKVPPPSVEPAALPMPTPQQIRGNRVGRFLSVFSVASC